MRVHSFFVVVSLCATAIARAQYQPVTQIPIGGEGGWDILTIDSAAGRLYLSHATKVVVVDLNKNARRVGNFADHSVLVKIDNDDFRGVREIESARGRVDCHYIPTAFAADRDLV
jgi:hypothetical protein